MSRDTRLEAVGRLKSHEEQRQVEREKWRGRRRGRRGRREQGGRKEDLVLVEASLTKSMLVIST